MNKILTFPFIFLIRAYQAILAPHIGHSCRFYPTCSHYTIEALEEHGLSGLLMGAKRILRCNPFGRSGYDGVQSQKEGTR